MNTYDITFAHNVLSNYKKIFKCNQRDVLYNFTLKK